MYLIFNMEISNEKLNNNYIDDNQTKNIQLDNLTCFENKNYIKYKQINYKLNKKKKTSVVNINKVLNTKNIDKKKIMLYNNKEMKNIKVVGNNKINIRQYYEKTKNIKHIENIKYLDSKKNFSSNKTNINNIMYKSSIPLINCEYGAKKTCLKKTRKFNLDLKNIKKSTTSIKNNLNIFNNTKSIKNEISCTNLKNKKITSNNLNKYKENIKSINFLPDNSKQRSKASLLKLAIKKTKHTWDDKLIKTVDTKDDVKISQISIISDTTNYSYKSKNSYYCKKSSIPKHTKSELLRKEYNKRKKVVDLKFKDKLNNLPLLKRIKIENIINELKYKDLKSRIALNKKLDKTIYTKLIINQDKKNEPFNKFTAIKNKNKRRSLISFNKFIYDRENKVNKTFNNWTKSRLIPYAINNNANINTKVGEFIKPKKCNSIIINSLNSNKTNVFLTPIKSIKKSLSNYSSDFKKLLKNRSSIIFPKQSAYDNKLIKAAKLKLKYYVCSDLVNEIEEENKFVKNNLINYNLDKALKHDLNFILNNNLNKNVCNRDNTNKDININKGPISQDKDINYFNSNIISKYNIEDIQYLNSENNEEIKNKKDYIKSLNDKYLNKNTRLEIIRKQLKKIYNKDFYKILNEVQQKLSFKNRYCPNKIEDKPIEEIILKMNKHLKLVAKDNCNMYNKLANNLIYNDDILKKTLLKKNLYDQNYNLDERVKSMKLVNRYSSTFVSKKYYK